MILRFAYVASHDLQEPLRMVNSYLGLLKKNYDPLLDEKGRKYISYAVNGAIRMRQIITDLLEFSRVGKTINVPENIQLNELVNEVLLLFKKEMNEKKAVNRRRGSSHHPLPQFAYKTGISKPTQQCTKILQAE